NADAITLSKRFWSDQPLRDAIVAEATEYVRSSQNVPEANAPAATSEQKQNAVAEPKVGDASSDLTRSQASGQSVSATQSPSANASEVSTLQGSIRRMNLLREHLPGVPLGWCFLYGEADTKAATHVGEHKARCWPDLIHPTTGIYEVSLAGTD